MESVPLYFSANPFGLKRVVLDAARNARVLLNGATRHGIQSADPGRSAEPLAYYDRSGPLGDVFSAWKPSAGCGSVAVIGLGVGCIAAYAQPGQHFVFYDIDPDIAKIAADPRYFTFLSLCRGTYEIVLGDGRESLEQAEDRRFGMIILDAFQDDSIPPHLVSADAVRLYLRKLQDQGLLVFQITNVHAALQPEFERLAGAEGLVCLSRADLQVSESERAAGKLPSHYLVLARDPASVSGLTRDPRWTNAGGKRAAKRGHSTFSESG